jgi:hypothetical protein
MGLDKEHKVVNIVTENSRKLIWNPVLGKIESCDYQSHSEIITQRFKLQKNEQSVDVESLSNQNERVVLTIGKEEPIDRMISSEDFVAISTQNRFVMWLVRVSDGPISRERKDGHIALDA